MVRQTKRFKKGLNKKVLSAILAASMIMTSSSFAFAGTNETEPLNEETQVNAEVQPTTGMDELGDDLDLTDDAVENNAATFAAPLAEDAVDAQTVNVDDEVTTEVVFNGKNYYYSEGTHVLSEPITYTGSDIKPEVTFKDGAYTLKEGTDYELEYSNNKNVTSEENAKIEVTFMGTKYQNLDSTTIEFKIAPLGLNGNNTKVDYVYQDAFTYNGKEQHPIVNSVVVTNELGEEITLNEDDYKFAGVNGDLVNVGTDQQLQIVGQGNYKDTYTLTDCTFSIQQASIDGAVTVKVDPVVFEADDTPYEVSQKILKNVTVIENATGKELNSEEDYYLEWYNEETGKYDKNNSPSTDIGLHSFRIAGSDEGNFRADTYVEAIYEIVKDGTLQMAVNNAYADGYKFGNFVYDSSSRKFITTYDGGNKANGLTTTNIITSLNASLLNNQVEVVEEPEEWVNAGEYTITLEGKNDYAGQTATITFKINPKNINSSETSEANGIKVEASQGYHRSGAAGDLSVSITDENIKVDGVVKSLVEGEDYTYTTKTEKDKTYVVVTGIGNYTTEIENTDNTYTEEVKIEKERLNLNDSSISAEITGTYNYTGNSIEPSPAAIHMVETDGSKEYVIGVGEFNVEYGENIAAGKGTITVTARDNSEYYYGSRTITFDINGESFEDVFEIADIKDFNKKDVTWEKIQKAIKVVYKNGGATYAVAKGDNSDRIKVEITKDGEKVDTTKAIAGGTYTVTVTPTDKGPSARYEGELTATFNVVGDNLKESGAKIADIEDVVYTGEEIKPAVVVTVGNKTLEEGKDYTVSYSDNVKGGEATVTVTGINNYSGTLEKNFKITRAAQDIVMTNEAQKRDLGNGSRNSMSKVCTLKLATTMADEDTKYTYTTSDPSVATVNAGKITYQGVGECTITVSAPATDSCEAASLDIKVVVGNPGTPTFTPSVTKNTAKKAFVVTSSTVRGADGFEVQYSIRDDFWKATTKDFSGTKSKLLRQTCTTVHSNRTYYVRVRAYQVVDGEKVYSTSWSPVKTIKTK